MYAACDVAQSFPRQQYIEGIKFCLKVECYYSQIGIYTVVVRLLCGKIDLGVVGEQRLHGKAITQKELSVRVQEMADALIPDDIESLAEAMIRKYKRNEDEDIYG